MFRYYTAIIILIVQHFQYNKKQNMTDKIFKIVLKYVRQKCIKTLKFYLKREILWVIFMLFLFISTWKLILTFEIRQYKGNKINLKKKGKSGDLSQKFLQFKTYSCCENTFVITIGWHKNDDLASTISLRYVLCRITKVSLSFLAPFFK